MERNHSAIPIVFFLCIALLIIFAITQGMHYNNNHCDEVKRATYCLTIYDRNGLAGYGSGFVTNAPGKNQYYLYSAKHILNRPSIYYQIVNEDRVILIKCNEATYDFWKYRDLARCKFNYKNPLPVCNVGKFVRGKKIVSVVATSSYISFLLNRTHVFMHVQEGYMATGRDLPVGGHGFDADLIEVSVTSRPGFSGSPIVQNDVVVGIITNNMEKLTYMTPIIDEEDENARR